MQKQLSIEAIKQKYIEFVNESKTFSISTLDQNGNPFISYAPFVKHEEKLYIFISAITEHYKFIEENELIHIMMIADDSKSPNLFARERVRFQCTSENIGNDNKEEIFSKFEEIHGASMIKLLRGLADMSLFELTPIHGRYVVGFGSAYDVDLSGNKFEHVVVDKNK
ncbi:heme iron utilization protein [Bacillus sp. AFS002410]|uniref:HugZ family pyridoxamine 5'-phosphate oxidase n=1 Tax=Bacillus sp. AFS002410 TaxID=2033481 RepID=UPI000BEF24D0|nr:pyridoxamine 5'-phosphate oxidase family protein [Bacillus sp. AFS002410]PEJ56771.1 heme iron utilization protein [Bacillus sp. AFS002410]